MALSGITEKVRNSDWAKGLRSDAGGVVGLLLGGNVEFIEVGRGIDAATPMEAGSLTKGFTGLLLAQALEHAELTLDTRLDEAIFGEHWPGESAITVLEVATHTSGLPRLSMPAASLLGDPYHRYDRDYVLRFLQKLKPRSPAKPTFSYSNFGFAVLGLALERAGGKTYVELMQDRLLDPLGLQHTQLQMADGGVLVSGGYNMFGTRAKPWRFRAYAPCGALVSTAQDLLQAAAAWCRPNSPVADAVALAVEPRRSIPAGQIGLAWLRPVHGDYVWHNGGTYGYQAYLAFSRVRNTAVVLLANQYGGKEITVFGHELIRDLLHAIG